jgi:aldehyde:ferredoxin oxidoreductase
MECVERGWWDVPWLRFGDGLAVLRAIDLIGRREGLGKELGEGSRRLAHQIGPRSLAIAPQVKGLELPGYEPRALQTMAIGFATGTRGADHNRSSAYEADFSERVDRRCLSEASATNAVESEDRAALLDSLILCKFLRGVFQDFYAEAAEMLALVTGWDVTAEELHHTARRIVAVKKLFNIRAGWTPSEDTLPDRFLQQAPADDPASRLSKDQLAQGVRAYNLARGWTAEGWLEAEGMVRLEKMTSPNDELE